MTKPNMLDERRRGRTRCAVYTRKSSDEGLDQAFNSLHAQREACESYIKSQKHEGWVCLPDEYDDGGISGATMDRPALRRLLEDIRAGKVEVIIVYKVDRLTRSLNDFAKIVEILDQAGASFVSVTQQFNTTTSMGRLTLNVLLSFAQFEREVAGERIRDKIAASKRKGMWMGGSPPLGYDIKDRKLVVNEGEAQIVRHVYCRYLELGSVRLLKQQLDAEGVVSKSHVSLEGRHWGGRPLARGALYLMLQNRIYIGEISHKDQHYTGDHAPIIERGVWDRVQQLLTTNAAERRRGARSKNPSLLVGLLVDGDGNRMTPTHAIKNGKRYRYYISRPLVTEGRASTTTGMRVPATEIEQLIGDRLCSFLADGGAVFDAIAQHIAIPREQQKLIEAAAALARDWPELSVSRRRGVVCALVDRIELHAERVDVRLTPSRVITVVGAHESRAMNDTTVTWSVAAALKRVGKETKLIVRGQTGAEQALNPGLIRLLVQARDFQQKLLRGEQADVATLAAREGITGSYFTRLLRLSWLAPDIALAILAGRQPATLTVSRLMEGASLPLDWEDQRSQLGFQ
jgi:site-specific DNA recombinase